MKKEVRGMRTIILDNSEESSDWLHKVAASNPDNRKRYFIEVTRRDIGLVSYCPGWEIKDDPDADWIDGVLVPAVEPIAGRRASKIRETPITFWVTVRRTARRPAEVFLFMTPAYPGAVIEDAVAKALAPVKDGKVHAGREPIPAEAVPCLQVFRGKIMRLYYSDDGHEGLHLPVIRLRDSRPWLVSLSVPQNGDLVTTDVLMEEAERLMVEARIDDALNGNSCRRIQQALTRIARETH